VNRRAGVLLGLGLGLLLVAALAYAGALHRYTVTRLGSDTLVRTDRLTGTSVACVVDDGAVTPALRCGGELPPVAAPLDSVDPLETEFAAWRRARDTVATIPGARPAPRP
jgi:hypothetical protein